MRIPYHFIAPAIVFITALSSVNGQTPSGFYTSEAATVSLNGYILISANKFNPSPEQVAAAAKPKKGEPMSVLQIPVEATSLNLFNRDFECKLYCLDSSGQLRWERTTGYSKRSSPAPVAAGEGFIYTGAPDKEKDEVILRKWSPEGKLEWETRLDSLENVDAICLAENRVNLLVSFDHQEKKSHPDGTFSLESFPVYFFVQLDPVAGKLIKKEYQMMGNYLSSRGYGKPLLNSDYSYYLSEEDSIAFLTVMEQGKATIASEVLPPGSTIAALQAGPESNHYLVRKKAGATWSYALYTDFYGRKEKYQSPVNEPVRNGQRCFLLLDKNETAWTLICQGASAQLYSTSKKGETGLVNKYAGTGTLVTGAGLFGDQPYLVILEGRHQPGKDGTLRIQHLSTE